MTTQETYQRKIVELLIRQELLIAELYRILADRFPAYREFWTSLHHEELGHAQWMEHLASRLKTDDSLFEEDRARVFTIRAFLDFITESIIKARTPRMTLDEALALSASLEESMLERRIFDRFDGDRPETEKALDRLRTETRNHALRIRKTRQNLSEA